MAQTLGPPLWATGSWATDAWATNSWSTEVALVFNGDLTTLFVGYVGDLRDDSVLLRLDSTSLVAADQPNVLDGVDLNTAYLVALN